MNLTAISESAVLPLSMLLIGAAITFLTSAYWRKKNARDDAAQKAHGDAVRAVEARKVVAETAAEVLKVRVTELEKQLALVTQSVVPLNLAYQAMLVKELTHFHTPVLDALLTKLETPNMMTDVEERDLISGLKSRVEEINELMPESEREAATMLPFVIKRVKAEVSSLRVLGTA